MSEQEIRKEERKEIVQMIASWRDKFRKQPDNEDWADALEFVIEEIEK